MQPYIKNPHDLDTVRSQLALQWPDLASAEIRFLDEGWDCAVFLVDGKIAFKFPKHPQARKALALEMAALTRLPADCAIPVPQLTHPGEGSAFFGYPYLEGDFLSERGPQGLDLEAMAAQAGAFLSQAHAVKLDAPRIEAHAAWPHEIANFQAAIADSAWMLGPELCLQLGEAIENFQLEPPTPCASCLVHGDLSAAHVLIARDGSRFSGVIDWADVRWSHPALDFVGFYAWAGPGFVKSVLDHYQGDLGGDPMPWVRQKTWVLGLLEVYHSFKTNNLKDRAAGLGALKTVFLA